MAKYMWLRFLNLDWTTFLVPDHSRLGLRSVERAAGAETEVEGETGFVSRLLPRRVGLLCGSHGGIGNEGRASPLIHSDEPDEEMVMEVSQPAPSGRELLPSP